jgi:serine/threonine protein kinase
LKQRQDKVDTWSGGVILYFMCSLKYPFDTNEENMKIAKKILKEKIIKETHDHVDGRS